MTHGRQIAAPAGVKLAMTATETILPPHAASLLEYMRRRAVPVTLNDSALFDLWRETDLTDLEIMAALDFLATIGAIGRSSERTLRCRVWVKESGYRP